MGYLPFFDFRSVLEPFEKKNDVTVGLSEPVPVISVLRSPEEVRDAQGLFHNILKVTLASSIELKGSGMKLMMVLCRNGARDAWNVLRKQGP